MEPFYTYNPYFTYKYVLYEDGQKVMWESGADRIADLELLPEITNSEAKLSTLKSRPKEIRNKEVKYVELLDEWNTYKVTFSVFHPFTNSDD